MDLLCSFLIIVVDRRSVRDGLFSALPNLLCRQYGDLFAYSFVVTRHPKMSHRSLRAWRRESMRLFLRASCSLCGLLRVLLADRV